MSLYSIRLLSLLLVLHGYWKDIQDPLLSTNSSWHREPNWTDIKTGGTEDECNRQAQDTDTLGEGNSLSVTSGSSLRFDL